MYFRLKAEDIKFGNLRREDNPNSNVVTWSTRGVKIFQLKQPNSSNTPFPHRFAVTPPSGFTGPCNPLSTDGFYVHVYQTMVEVRTNVWITLNSKLIAKELGQMCGTSYLPRGPSHRHYAEDNQNPRMSSQRQQPYQTSHEAHQQNFLNRQFNRDQAYPPNWSKQYTMNTTSAHLNATKPINFRSPNNRSANILQPGPMQSMPQPLQMAYPVYPNQQWMPYPNTNPHIWQPINPSNHAQQQVPQVRSPPLHQHTEAFQRNRHPNM